MFFYFLTEPAFLETNEKETNTFTIGDLFEVFNGVLEDRHLPIVAETNSEINFIRVNSFSDSNALFDKQQLDEIQLGQVKKKENLFTNTNDRKPVNDKKVLIKEDYIIYTRGLPRGFSMLNAPIGNELNVVATHQFICLRPRTKLIEVYMPYLHLVLDLFVEKDLKELFDSKLIKNGDKYSVFNSVNIKEIKDMELTTLKLVSGQKKAYDRFCERKQEFDTAVFRLNIIKDLVYNNDYL